MKTLVTQTIHHDDQDVFLKAGGEGSDIIIVVKEMDGTASNSLYLSPKQAIEFAEILTNYVKERMKP